MHVTPLFKLVIKSVLSVCHSLVLIYIDALLALLHKWLVVPVANPLFVPVLEPGQGFRDKSLEAFAPGGRTETKGA